MKLVIWKNYFGGQILYRSLVPSQKRRHCQKDASECLVECGLSDMDKSLVRKRKSTEPRFKQLQLKFGPLYVNRTNGKVESSRHLLILIRKHFCQTVNSSQHLFRARCRQMPLKLCQKSTPFKNMSLQRAVRILFQIFLSKFHFCLFFARYFLTKTHFCRIATYFLSTLRLFQFFVKYSKIYNLFISIFSFQFFHCFNFNFCQTFQICHKHFLSNIFVSK